ncbi:hypothetical protein ACHE4M_003035 [Vibrio cholerae]|nr:hypothetical protein [Vibrio cholerae]
MSNTISYSNNYQNMIAGSVNERNGSFDFTMGIANIIGNHLKGPELNLSLSFNQNETLDMGLGDRLRFNLPFFDCQNRIFYSDQGMMVKLNSLLTDAAETSLDNFSITVNSNIFIVTYHDGNIDEFTKIGNGRYAYLTKRKDAFGNYITLRWDFNNKLESIKDGEGCEHFKLNRVSGENAYQMSIGSGRYYIYCSTSKLTKKVTVTSPYFEINNYTDVPSYIIVFRLSTVVHYYLIDNITLPNGSKQLVNYHELQNELLPSAEVGVFKAPVKKHQIVTSGGDIIKETIYDFNPDCDNSIDGLRIKNNAYGFGGQVNLLQGSDPTYTIKPAYFYKVTVTEFDHEQNARVVSSIYDKFHNLREQEISFKGCIVKDKFNYYVSDTHDVQTQDKRFKLVNNRQRIYINAGREFIENYEYEYDSFGNLLSETDHLNNVKNIYQYYDSRSADVDGCPKYKFIYFLKSQTVHDLKSEAKRIICVRKYQKLGPGILLESEISPYSGVNVEFKYYSEGDDLGRLRSRQISKDGLPLKIQNFSYQIDNDTLRLETISRSDLVPDEEFRTILNFDYRTGQKLLIDNSETLAIFEYYPDGRLKKEVSCPNSINECSREYKYEDSLSVAETKDSFGNVKKSFFDALGNIIEVRITIPGVVEDFIVEKKIYNQLGQIISSTSYDITVNSKTGLVQNQQWTLLTSYIYDGWMNLERTIHPDGVIEFNVYDPISQTETHGIEGKSYQVSISDLNGRKVQEKIYDKNGTLLNHITSLFDCFGNIIQKTNDFGVIKSFTYDSLDRVIRSVVTFINYQGDSSNIIKDIEYCPYHLNADFIKSIRVNNKVLGENTYDVFSRLLEQKVNGQTTKFNYPSGSLSYNRITMPDNIDMNVSYNAELSQYTKLGSREQKINLRGLTEHAFDSKTGSSFNYQYRFDGILECESSENSENLYDYTLLGVPTASLVAGNNFEIIQYDELKRIISVDDGMTTAYYSDFDEISRPQLITVCGSTSMQIRYDYSNLPKKLVIKTSQGNDELVEEESYTNDGKLEEKITTLGSEQLIETYEYDAMRRLIKYNADGDTNLLPKDEFGRDVLEQVFKFDDFGNIKEVITSMKGDEINRSIFFYNPDYPTQLYSIENSHVDYANVNFHDKYDTRGSLCEDQYGRKYKYNDYGELASVLNNEGQELTSYEYDAIGRLNKQIIHNEPSIEYFYANDNLIFIKQGDVGLSNSIVNGRLVSKRFQSQTTDFCVDYLCNSSNSPIKVKSGDSENKYSYMPYGYRSKL